MHFPLPVVACTNARSLAYRHTNALSEHAEPDASQDATGSNEGPDLLDSLPSLTRLNLVSLMLPTKPTMRVMNLAADLGTYHRCMLLFVALTCLDVANRDMSEVPPPLLAITALLAVMFMGLPRSNLT